MKERIKVEERFQVNKHSAAGRSKLLDCTLDYHNVGAAATLVCAIFSSWLNVFITYIFIINSDVRYLSNILS